MGWKALGEPVVRRQRDRWVVRVDGIDTSTGQRRPRQLGTYPSHRAATAAARTAVAQGRTSAERGTVSWLIRRWVTSRTDISIKAQEQYAWAIPHIEAGLGAVRLDHLDRSDIATWLDDLATSGRLGRRSITVCRTVLKAALTDAVEEQLLRRNPAARVPMPRDIARPDPVREADAWDHDQVQRFLTAAKDHRWGGPFRLAVLYGLRRSELLALTWDDVDLDEATIRINKALVAVKGGTVLTDGKTRRSRRLIPVDPTTVAALAAHRRHQRVSRETRCRPAQCSAQHLTVTRGRVTRTHHSAGLRTSLSPAKHGQRRKLAYPRLPLRECRYSKAGQKDPEVGLTVATRNHDDRVLQTLCLRLKDGRCFGGPKHVESDLANELLQLRNASAAKGLFTLSANEDRKDGEVLVENLHRLT